MRFTLSSAAVVAALPGLAAAAEGSVLDQYKAQFQNFMGKVSGYVQNPPQAVADPVAAVESKVGSTQVSHLTLDNWRDTLYSHVKPGAKEADEWWVLISGRNKTCYGNCEKAEKAFTEASGRFAILPKAPRTAIVNCDEQPVLCNSWSAGPGAIWAFDMLPPPAEIDIYKTRLNLTTVSSDDLVALHTDGRKNFALLDSWFHPFNGKAAELGVAVPLGYVLWGFGLVPNWAFMLIVSFASRTMMSNRMAPPNRAAGGAPAAAPAQ